MNTSTCRNCPNALFSANSITQRITKDFAGIVALYISFQARSQHPVPRVCSWVRFGIKQLANVSLPAGGSLQQISACWTCTWAELRHRSHPCRLLGSSSRRTWAHPFRSLGRGVCNARSLEQNEVGRSERCRAGSHTRAGLPSPRQRFSAKGCESRANPWPFSAPPSPGAAQVAF